MTQRFTLDEAAAQLKAPSSRWLADWLRAHPRDKSGDPYFTPVGRAKVFRSDDIARIEIALREALTCRSNSARRGKAKRPTSRSEERTSESEWRLVAELTNDPSLAPSSSRSKNASSNTGNTPLRKLNLIQGGRPS